MVVVGCDEPEKDYITLCVETVELNLTSVESDSVKFNKAIVTGSEEASVCM